MTEAGPNTSAPPGTPQGEDRLDSWKEIAAYLNREVRTVQRWEKSEGLPVHRHLHARQGTVFAYRSELDTWWQTRSSGLEQADASAVGERTAGLPASVRWVAGVAGLLLLVWVVILGGYSLWNQLSSSAQRVTLVVLPFEEAGAGADQDYFSEGLTEELISHLAQTRPDQLGVIGRTSAMHYKGTTKTVEEIGRELNVEYVLEGSVRREGDQVRIDARLLRADSQTQLWADSFEREVTNLLPVWKEVAERISDSMTARLLRSQSQPGETVATANPKAYEAYLRGRYFLNKRTVADLQKAREQFEIALAQDDRYAPAHAGLAESFALLGSVSYDAIDPRVAMERAQAAAETALQLDPRSAEAHSVRAYVSMAYEWDWPAAEASFRRALQLDPSHAPAHHWYAYFLTAMGRSEQAIAEVRRSLELDPVSLPANASLGWHLYFAGRYAEAEAHLKRTLELEPSFAPARFDLGMVYLQQGRHADALAEFRRAADLTGEEPLILAALGHASAVAGRPVDARSIAARLEVMRQQRFVPSVYLAGVHLALGEREEALRWLKQALEERSDYLLYLPIDPVFAELRQDSSFRELLIRIGLKVESPAPDQAP